VIIRFRTASSAIFAPTSSQRDELLRAGAANAFESLGEPGLIRVPVRDGFTPESVAISLRGESDVLYAEPDRMIQLSDPTAHYETTSDPTSNAPAGWSLNAIDASQADKLGIGSGVVVAVLDTGVSASHPDLAGRVLPGWNFVSNDANAGDDAGHGTFVAGLIAGVTSDGAEGVAPGASILPVKILDSAGSGSTASFVAGINYAVNSGARIINISASGASDSQALSDALANAESHGVLVVASTGNEATQLSTYPAAAPTVLAVSATDQANQLASFSSYGAYIDLAAPGVDVRSSWWSSTGGNGHATASGTSAAAPLVSGVAAVVAGLRPDMTPSALRELLTQSAIDVGTPGIDAQTGYGLVDAYAAARLTLPPTTDGTANIAKTQAGDGDHLSFSGGGFAAGEQVLLWTISSDGYQLYRSKTAAPDGSVSVDLGPAWRFPDGSLTAYAMGAESGHASRAQFDVTIEPAAGPFQPVGPVPSTLDRTYFPDTGHTLAYGFKSFWESHGGLAVFGYPISEEFSETNPDTGQTYTVQYFERDRFEYHPELAGTPAEISLGRIGIESASQTFPMALPPVDSATLYFDATQHTLSGPFRSYWESHDGLALFGYPISEPFEQDGLLVQYFERGRFEFHPDLPAGSQVLLSRLGVTLARVNGYLH
jgi:hypothetical protein